MGFRMGEDDAPFEERMWGVGRRLAPTARGRRGCMLLLYAAFLAVALALVIAALVAR